MLYDPKWDQQTKADPFSLESLIAWLQMRDPTERYDFCMWNQCLLGQWLRSFDPAAYAINPDDQEYAGLTGFHYRVLGEVVDLNAFKHIANGGNYRNARLMTFGAALARARA